MKQKIIYSMKVMQQLVEMGFLPTATLPNPKDTKYNCWVFDWTEEFDKALCVVLKGASRSG